jgi:hypothetical protein
VPTVVSMICSPDGVVKVFPIWADAAVGANARAAIATAITEIIERWNIIPAPSLFPNREGV